MTTEDIILWVDKAIEVREASYQKPDGITFIIGTYRKTPYDCVLETKSEEAKDYDVSIALWMVEYGNDVTEWKKQILEDKQKPKTVYYPLLEQAARDFVFKVDKGYAKSTNSYNQFKQALGLD